MRRKDILKNLSFCITGKTFEKTQAEMAEVVISYGGKVRQNVSPNTDYLIRGIQVAKNIKGGLSESEKRAIRKEKYIFLICRKFVFSYIFPCFI